MTALDWVPQSCTLPTEERPLRAAEWDALFAERLREVSRPDALRLRLDLGAADTAARARVRDLAAREGDCCAFFTFTVTADTGTLLLDIAVDAAHTPVLDALAVRAARASRQ